MARGTGCKKGTTQLSSEFGIHGNHLFKGIRTWQKIVIKGPFMTITCGSCLTKFRLDDSKISTKGAKVRCSRCQHIFLVTPPPEATEEISEDFESSPRCHEALIEPDQKKEGVSLPLKIEKMEKVAEDTESHSLHKETLTEKAEQGVPEKPVREERIKVKTFKIGQNSFGIEWNIYN